MDPVTVVSLVAVSAQLLQQTFQAVIALNDARKQFENVPQTLTLMHMVCKMSLASTRKINAWIEGTVAASPQNQEYMSDLEEGLRDCTIFMSSFQKSLGKYLEHGRSGSNALSWRLRAGFVWNEKEMRRHYEDITIVSQHLQLLLNTTQLPIMPARAADDNISLATSRRALHRSSINLERDLSMSRVYQNAAFTSSSGSVLSDDGETVWYMAAENFSTTDSLRRTRSTNSLAKLQITSRPTMPEETITSQAPVFRASYGILCSQIYNPVVHEGEEIHQDSSTGRQWAVEQLDWMILKGDRIPYDGDTVRRRPFKKTFPSGDRPHHVSVTIFVSHEDREKLPQSLRHRHGIEKLCVVEGNLSDMAFERRRRQWWNAKSSYNIATFELIAKVGPGGSDLSFDLLQRLDS